MNTEWDSDPLIWQAKIITAFENAQSSKTTLPSLNDSEFESFLSWLGQFASSEDSLSKELILLAKNRTNAQYRLLKIIDDIWLQSPINLQKLFGQYTQLEDIPTRLKKRYFLLARIFHPDRQMAGETWTTERMELINMAYQEALQLPPEKFIKKARPSTANSSQSYAIPKSNRHFSFGQVITDALNKLRLISFKYIDHIRHFKKTILISFMVLIGVYFIVIKAGIVLEKSNNKTQAIATSPPIMASPNVFVIDKNEEQQNLGLALPQSPDINKHGLDSYSLSTKHDAYIDKKTQNQTEDGIFNNDLNTTRDDLDGGIPRGSAKHHSIRPAEHPLVNNSNKAEFESSQQLKDNPGEFDGKEQISTVITNFSSKANHSSQKETIDSHRVKLQLKNSAVQTNLNNSLKHANSTTVAGSESTTSTIASYSTPQAAQKVQIIPIDLHRLNHQTPVKVVNVDSEKALKHANTKTVVDSESTTSATANYSTPQVAKKVKAVTIDLHRLNHQTPVKAVHIDSEKAQKHAIKPAIASEYKVSKSQASNENLAINNKHNKIFTLDKNTWVIQSMIYLNYNDAKLFIRNQPSSWFIVPILEHSMIKYLLISNTAATLESAQKLKNKSNSQQSGKPTIRSVKYLQDNFQVTY